MLGSVHTTSLSPTSPTLFPINDGGSTNTFIRLADVSLLLDPTSVTKSSTFTVQFGNGDIAAAIGEGLTNTPFVQAKAYIFKDTDLIRSCISHADFTEQGCVILETAEGCTISQVATGNIVNYTPKNHSERLWPFRPMASGASHTVVHHQLNAERVLHAWETFCCAPPSSVLSALRQSYFVLPNITAKMFYENLPSRPASALGHLDRTRMHYNSRVKPKTDFDNLPPVTVENDIPTSDIPPDEPTCFYSVLDPRADEVPGIFADGTGRFPFLTLSGYKLILVWEFNGFVDHVLLKEETAEEYQQAYSTLLAFLHAKGHRPTFVRLDMHGSQTHPSVQHSISDAGLTVQFLPPGPGGHRSNRAEGSIRHIKNHFISCIANVDPTFPTQVYDKLLPQVFLTYQLLTPWRPDPTISAFEGLFGHKFDFNAHPLHIPGQKCIVFEDPQERASFAPHGVNGFMIGPMLSGYRMWTCWIPSTSSIRSTDTVSMIDRKIDLPNASVADTLNDSIQNVSHNLHTLISALDNLSPTAAAEIGAREAADALTRSQSTLRIQFPNRDPPSSAPSLVDPSSPQRVADPASLQRVATATRSKKKKSYSWLPVSNNRVRQIHQAPYLDFIGRKFIDDNITWYIAGIYHKSTSDELYYAYYDSSLFDTTPALSILEFTPCFEMINIDIVPPVPRASWVDLLPLPSLNSITAIPDVDSDPPGLITDSDSDSHSDDGDFSTDDALSSDKKPQSNYRSQRYQQTQGFLHSISHYRTGERSLNLNSDGSPMTFKSARNSVDGDLWQQYDDIEWSKLFDYGTIEAIDRSAQPVERRKDTTYVSTQIKEKFAPDGSITGRVRNALGGDRINYPGPTSSNVADDKLVLLVQQSVLGHRKKGINQRFCTADFIDFYIQSILTLDSVPRPEFMRVPASRFSHDMRNKYRLHDFIHEGYILFQVNGNIWGIPGAGLIANTDLVAHLLVDGWTEDPDIPCLFHKIGTDIWFVLVVDDTGISYNADKPDELAALFAHLQTKYPMKIDMSGSKFLGIQLDWNYDKNYLDRSSPSVWPDLFARFCPDGKPKSARSPGHYVAFSPGAGSTIPLFDDSPALNAAGKLYIQQFVGTLLHYARNIDFLLLPYLRAIADSQANPTENTKRACDRILAYGVSHPNCVVRYHATDMILSINSDASHQSCPNSGSVIGGYHQLINCDSDTDFINGPTSTICRKAKTVCASAAETEYAGLYENGREAMDTRTILAKLNFPQTTTSVHTDNDAAKKIVTKEIRPKRSKAIDMRYHWMRDRTNNGIFKVIWTPNTAVCIQSADALTKIQPVKNHEKYISQFVTYM